jgi:hypothetical protein
MKSSPVYEVERFRAAEALPFNPGGLIVR